MLCVASGEGPRPSGELRDLVLSDGVVHGDPDTSYELVTLDDGKNMYLPQQKACSIQLDRADLVDVVVVGRG